MSHNDKTILFFDATDDDTGVASKQTVFDTISKLEKQLEAYQKAFNKVDDWSEYRDFDRGDFAEIADYLTRRLKDIDEQYAKRN